MLAYELHILIRKPNFNGNEMKNLLDMIFKRELHHDYVIANYQPGKANKRITETKMVAHEGETDADSSLVHDEMEIDNLYQKN